MSRHLLPDVAADAQDGNTLMEVGTWLGHSAAFLTHAIRDSATRLAQSTIDHHFWCDEAAQRESVNAASALLIQDGSLNGTQTAINST